MGHEETDPPEAIDHGEEDDFSLNTDRLKLRRPCRTDANALAELANDFDIASKLTNMPYPYGLSDARFFLDRVQSKRKPEMVLFITERSHGRLMGCCSLRARPVEGEYEIGYWLGRAFWGRGFATEAVHALVDYAFTATDLERLFVSCRVTNSSSRRVIHKSGFQPDGTDMIASLAMGGPVPVEVYALDRATWRGLREWREERDHACL